MNDKIKSLLGSDYSHTVMWVVAFVGVCVLVGVGKIKPETVEYLLFAMGGAVASRKLSPGSVIEPSEGDKGE